MHSSILVELTYTVILVTYSNCTSQEPLFLQESTVSKYKQFVEVHYVVTRGLCFLDNFLACEYPFTMIVYDRRWGEKYGKCNDVVSCTVGKNVGEARQWECVFVWHYNFPSAGPISWLNIVYSHCQKYDGFPG